MESPLEGEQTHKTRKAWSKEEDDVLLQCIHDLGVGQWSRIAQSFRDKTGCNRSTKQCRNRWFNSLDPSVNHNDWSPEEEHMIYDLQKQHGNKWAEIAKHLNRRS